MITLDMRTIIFSFVIIDLSVTLVMILLWLQNRKRFRGTGLWVIDFILFTVAMILIALRERIPDLISVDLSNTMTITGLIVGLIAMNRFTGIKTVYLPHFALLVIFAFVHTWFTFIRPDLSVRTLNLSLAMVLFSAQYIWLSFFRLKDEMRKITTGVGLVFIGYFILNIIRIIRLITIKLDYNDFYQSDNFERSVVILYQVLFIMLTFSIVLMYNRRLSFEIASQEEKFSKAFQSSPYAILITRLADGEIMDVNKGFAVITGYKYSDAVGKTTKQLQIWIKDEDRAEFIEELQGGGVFEKENNFRIRSGNIITGLLSAEIITVNDEKLIIASINDITEKKNNEKMLKEKLQDLERINKFMTGRELRMIELKKEINELCGMLGIKERY
jgi:PAS domain S-box-containing protein